MPPSFRSKAVRTLDDVGRMHVANAHICMAGVNPYKGSEIPGWRELGLDGDVADWWTCTQ